MMGEDLFHEVSSNNIASVKALIAAGAAINIRDNERLTPLMVACWQGHTDIAESLIKAGADISVSDNEGLTPLLMACQQGYADIVEILLDAGADINQTGVHGFSPLEIAIVEKQAEIVKVLIQHHCNVFVQNNGRGMMHVAAYAGSVAIGSMLLKQGLPLDTEDEAGRTPLHWAAQEGRCRFARWLLDNGVRVDAEDQTGDTPLRIASGEGYYRLARLLLEKNANVNCSNAGGTALHRAFAWNRGKIVDLLAAHGARFDLRDGNRKYPIWYAVEYGYDSLVRKYIARYADILTDREKEKLIKRASSPAITNILSDAD